MQQREENFVSKQRELQQIAKEEEKEAEQDSEEKNEAKAKKRNEKRKNDDPWSQFLSRMEEDPSCKPRIQALDKRLDTMRQQKRNEHKAERDAQRRQLWKTHYEALPVSERVAIDATFKKLDTGGHGVLDVEELFLALSELGLEGACATEKKAVLRQLRDSARKDSASGCCLEELASEVMCKVRGRLAKMRESALKRMLEQIPDEEKRPAKERLLQGIGDVFGVEAQRQHFFLDNSRLIGDVTETAGKFLDGSISLSELVEVLGRSLESYNRRALKCQRKMQKQYNLSDDLVLGMGTELAVLHHYFHAAFTGSEIQGSALLHVLAALGIPIQTHPEAMQHVLRQGFSSDCRHQELLCP